MALPFPLPGERAFNPYKEDCCDEYIIYYRNQKIKFYHEDHEGHEGHEVKTNTFSNNMVLVEDDKGEGLKEAGRKED